MYTVTKVRKPGRSNHFSRSVVHIHIRHPTVPQKPYRHKVYPTAPTIRHVVATLSIYPRVCLG